MNLSHSAAVVRPIEGAGRGRSTTPAADYLLGRLHVVRNPSEAVEFLSRSGRLASDEGARLIARLIVLDFESSGSQAFQIAELIRRGLGSEPVFWRPPAAPQSPGAPSAP